MATRPKSTVSVTLLILGIAGVAAVGVSKLRERDRVVVVGDSMVSFARGDLSHAGHAAEYDLSIDGIPGVPLSARLDTLRQTAAKRPARVVVELGTNDVLTDQPKDVLTATIDQAASILQDVHCVVFVNVGILAGPVDLAAFFNQQLHDQLTAHPNEHEFDWASVYSQHPDWSADSVHVTAPHWRDYASGIVNAVQRDCA